MKLYNSLGPNPRVVRMFMSEKGISIPFEEVDIRGAANRREPYLQKNAAGQLPALELDNGRCITEVTAICEYLEDMQPKPPLVGSTPEEKAETRMWTRRIDLGICEPMANGFRYAEGLEMFKDRMRVLPEAAAGLKACAQDKLAWLDGLMDGKTWIAGDRFTLADIHLYCFLDFAAGVGQPLDPENARVQAWFDRVAARPSAAASLHAAAAQVGMRV
ncbi:MAG TPA: glutathione S-transferase family protein [Thermoanaerobaculia bacterium]|nr:glutathione S-transferase family protein [Thermoanaerobaculia bacterium]